MSSHFTNSVIASNVVDCPGALILGGGLAGLFTALRLAPYPATVIAGPGAGRSGSSVWAQGGIAAAVGDDDSPALHAADTIAAGAGLCDPTVTQILTREAPSRIADLLRIGVPFDRDAQGKLSLTLEAAHSRHRIVHVQGDRSGLLITRALADAARATPSISFLEGLHAVELAQENGRVIGLFARAGHGADARLVFLRAAQIVIATGGLGALYAVTTNPPESRGEGLGMAARAGALISDPEFVQFHPTAMNVGRDPAPLVSETVRGAGAMLVNEKGARFMEAIHPLAELAPRDVVARAVHREIARGGKVFIDARESVGAAFPDHFPAVCQLARDAGIDPVTQLIPVAPAAHYHMGGIVTDIHGRTSLPGLWACGECASTGIHGANRLASNSLLEGLVFGARVADDIRGDVAVRHVSTPHLSAAHAPAAAPQILRDAMSRHAGIERSEAGLRTALSVIANVERAGNGDPALLNITAAAKLTAAAALARHESRGGHFRSDYPAAGATPARTFMTLTDAERIAADAAETAVPRYLNKTAP